MEVAGRFFLPTPSRSTVDNLFTMNGVLLAGYYMPFDPATAEATKADMARRVGVSRWEDLEVPLGSEQRKKMVAGFEAALGSGLASWFGRHDEGPFLEGNTPMYADLIIGGWLRMMKNFFAGMGGAKRMAQRMAQGIVGEVA
ncbi:MAG: hypothetical protein Q9211_001106 [Gyalolechia sp. 1 TL-2023]